LTDRSLQRRADGAVSLFGPMSPVTVRVTTLMFGPVKFDRVIKLVHSTEFAVPVVKSRRVGGYFGRLVVYSMRHPRWWGTACVPTRVDPIYI